jgi:hypothetical protein
MMTLSLAQPIHSDQSLLKLDEKGASSRLTSVESTGRLNEERFNAIQSEINEAILAIAERNGLSLTRTIIRKENQRELSAFIRVSVVDANGFDALHRDLLEYCHTLNFKASIMTAVMVSEGVEYQVSGLDLSTKNHMFRLSSKQNDIKYVSFDKLKAILPTYFS